MSAPLIVGLDVADRPATVVGGGTVAARKVQRLLDGGAVVTVVAPALEAALGAAADAGRLAWRARGYAAGDLAGAMLVVAATDDPATNAAVAADAEEGGMWCVRADAGDAGGGPPARGSAAFAATVQRGPLQLAVSTGGGGPALAAHIARELAQRYGPEWGELAALLGELRADPAVASALAGCDETERARRWRSVLAADTLTYLRTGDRPRAREVALSCLSSPSG